MIELRRILTNANVSSLIRAKSNQKRQILALPPSATVETALICFIENDITAIPIMSEHGALPESVFGVLLIVDVLNFLLIDAPDDLHKNHATRLLREPLAQIMKCQELHQLNVVEDRIALIDVLLKYWNPTEDKENQLDPLATNYHLLVKCTTDRMQWSIITPTDLLRYVMFYGQKSDFLQHTFIDDLDRQYSLFIKWASVKKVHVDEEAWKAFQEVSHTLHSDLVAVVDTGNNALMAHVSSRDFLPASSNDLKNMVLALRMQGNSLLSYLCAIKNVSSGAATHVMLDPVLLRENYTLHDVLGKMIGGRAHHLWRVKGSDHANVPIGVVGIRNLIHVIAQVVRSAI